MSFPTASAGRVPSRSARARFSRKTRPALSCTTMKSEIASISSTHCFRERSIRENRRTFLQRHGSVPRQRFQEAGAPWPIARAPDRRGTRRPAARLRYPRAASEDDLMPSQSFGDSLCPRASPHRRPHWATRTTACSASAIASCCWISRVPAAGGPASDATSHFLGLRGLVPGPPRAPRSFPRHGTPVVWRTQPAQGRI